MTIESPSRKLHWYDYIFVNANWFGLTLRSQVLAGLVVPLLVQGFVGESQKGTYYGTIRLWALMMALLKIVEEGGMLATSSCSHHVDRETILAILRSAAKDAARSPRLIDQTRSQARDHPVLLSVPETEYLKCIFLVF